MNLKVQIKTVVVLCVYVLLVISVTTIIRNPRYLRFRDFLDIISPRKFLYEEEGNSTSQPSPSASSSKVYKIYPSGKLFGKVNNWFFRHWKRNLYFHCEDNVRCQYTGNDTDADAVIFHARELKSSNLDYLLKRRKQQQRWVFFSWESIVNANIRLSAPWRSQFNWTATYMRDSDIIAPYYRKYVNLTFSELKKVASHPLYEKNKVLAAFAVISNCQVKVRKTFINRIKRFFKVDVFGACGRPLKKSEEAVLQLSRKYRYYLAFENSRCRDYVTEKFWFNGLMGDAIPVVFGGYDRKDYETVAPPNSFVYANDFSSVRNLTNFLKQLAANESEYAKYHEWKKKWKVDTYPMQDTLLCNLCQRLHTDKERKIADIDKFWNVSSRCLKARSLP